MENVPHRRNGMYRAAEKIQIGANSTLYWNAACVWGGGYDCMPYTLKVFRCPIIALWHPKILCSLHFQVLFLMTSTNKISAHWTIASKWFLSVVPRFQYRLANLEKSFWLRDGLFCRTKGGLLSDFFLLCLYGIFGSPGK